jgi:hypothetical protein
VTVTPGAAVRASCLLDAVLGAADSNNVGADVSLAGD